MVTKKGEPETDWPYEEPQVPSLPEPYQLRSERVKITEKEEVGRPHLPAFHLCLDSCIIPRQGSPPLLSNPC